jgi:hypothetical protein
MYALLIFGPLVERKIGSKRFIIAYLISGLFAGIIYSLYYTFIKGLPQTSALGASGAIMGLLGLVIILLPNLRVLFFFVIPMSMRTAGIIFALLDLAGFLGVNDGIAHLAHLSGLAIGLLFGWLYLTTLRNYLRKPFRGSRFSSSFGFSTRGGSLFRILNKNSKIESVKSAKGSNFGKSSRVKQNKDTIELTKDDLDNYFKYGKF